MTFTLFERFTKLSLIRAVFWLVMGASLLIEPDLDFLLNRLFYMLIGYLFIIAVLRIIFFANEATTGSEQKSIQTSVIRCSSLAVAIVFVIVAIHLIIFREWLHEFIPVFLGGLLMLEGVLYFVIALCAATALQKFLLVILSGATCLTAIISIGFTFGFGVNGIAGMATVLGIALLLAFLYEIAAFLVARKNRVSCFEQEDMK